MKYHNYNIIFDLDGTLVHSVPDMHNAINKTLTQYNLENISEQKLQTFVGEGMLSLSKKVVDYCGGNQELYETVFNSYRQNYSEEPYKYSTVMPGVMNALNYFYNQKIPMGICTNKRQFVTEKLIQEINHDTKNMNLRFKLANQYLSISETEKGFNELLKLFEQDPSWNEEAAKKKLLELKQLKDEGIISQEEYDKAAEPHKKILLRL